MPEICGTHADPGAADGERLPASLCMRRKTEALCHPPIIKGSRAHAARNVSMRWWCTTNTTGHSEIVVLNSALTGYPRFHEHCSSGSSSYYERDPRRAFKARAPLLPLVWLFRSGTLLQSGRNRNDLAFANGAPMPRASRPTRCLATRLAIDGDRLDAMRTIGCHCPKCWLRDEHKKPGKEGGNTSLHRRQTERRFCATRRQSHTGANNRRFAFVGDYSRFPATGLVY